MPKKLLDGGGRLVGWVKGDGGVATVLMGSFFAAHWSHWELYTMSGRRVRGHTGVTGLSVDSVRRGAAGL